MRNQNILFLDQYSGLSGGQKVLLDIIKSLSKKGWFCTVVLPGKGLLLEKIEALGGKCVIFPIGKYGIGKKSLLDILNYAFKIPALTFMLVGLIKKNNPDVVYANGARTFAWATLACTITKKPLLWHVHSIFEKGINQKICLFFGRFNIVKKIIAVSRAAALGLNKLSGKIEIIYNAVEEFNPDQRINILKDTYKIPADALLVGNAGILEEWKNQEDLVRAARIIQEKAIENIYFFLIGDSVYKDNYRNMLIKMIQNADLEKRVIFTGFRKDINQVMSSLDILVINSKTPDPCPLVSLEAASLGLAIISTDFGGTKEIFSENKEAIFYKAGDYHCLAEKIVYLNSHREEIHALGKQARLKVREKHNLNKYLKRIADILEGI
ncbi:glycosyltransferase family 1 protein [bacterium]|nr:MAG: glycosyltransferase family 1 protein [bacterium]